jgi:hypothetical protein
MLPPDAAPDGAPDAADPEDADPPAPWLDEAPLEEDSPLLAEPEELVVSLV